MTLTFDFTDFDGGMRTLLQRVDHETQSAGANLATFVRPWLVMPVAGQSHPVRRSGELQDDLKISAITGQAHRFGMTVRPGAPYATRIERLYPWFVPGVRSAVPHLGQFWFDTWRKAVS